MMQAAQIVIDNAERYRNLGYAIAYYRKRKGMTQEQVAEKVSILLDVLINIAAALEIEPCKLLKFSPEK